jgi:hypothetical protein
MMKYDVHQSVVYDLFDGMYVCLSSSTKNMNRAQKGPNNCLKGPGMERITVTRAFFSRFQLNLSHRQFQIDSSPMAGLVSAFMQLGSGGGDDGDGSGGVGEIQSVSFAPAATTTPLDNTGSGEVKRTSIDVLKRTSIGDVKPKWHSSSTDVGVPPCWARAGSIVNMDDMLLQVGSAGAGKQPNNDSKGGGVSGGVGVLQRQRPVSAALQLRVEQAASFVKDALRRRGRARHDVNSNVRLRVFECLSASTVGNIMLLPSLLHCCLVLVEPPSAAAPWPRDGLLCACVMRADTTLQNIASHSLFFCP